MKLDYWTCDCGQINPDFHDNCGACDRPPPGNFKRRDFKVRRPQHHAELQQDKPKVIWRNGAKIRS